MGPAAPGLLPPAALGPETLAHLQRAIGNAGVAAYLDEGSPASPMSVVAEAGRSLDPAMRSQMESSLGEDLSTVRVHEGDNAAASAKALGARAYTVGEDVVVGEGGADRRTMAHELTHVVQQRAGPVDGAPTGAGFNVSDPSDRFERAASAAASAIVTGAVRTAVGAGTAGSARGAPATAQRTGEEDEERNDTVQREDDEEVEAPKMITLTAPINRPSDAGTGASNSEPAPKMITVSATADRPNVTRSPTDSVEHLQHQIDLHEEAYKVGTSASVEHLQDLINLHEEAYKAGHGESAGSPIPGAVTKPEMTTSTSTSTRPQDQSIRTGPETVSATTMPAAPGGASPAQTAAPVAPTVAVGGSAAVGQPASQGGILGSLWGSAVVGPIRSAATATAGEKPDYKAAAESLRRAKEAVIGVVGSLPVGDTRINQMGGMLTEIDLMIEAASRRANEAGDLPANISSIIGATADDAAGLGSALKA